MVYNGDRHSKKAGGTYLSSSADFGKPRAIICSVNTRTHRAKTQDEPVLSAKESAHELLRLAETLGMEVIMTVIQERTAPDPATYLGKGKAREVAELAAEHGAQFTLIDGHLSPTQAKNLEDTLGTAVLDRTEVILRIFAQRANTKEGRLQVELATRRHELTRLTGYGTVMSSLGAGIGTRGPGEQKLEVDRRVLRNRIAWLSKETEKVRKVREEQRKQRRESQIPLVSLVGYTNAGKSTLFKGLTGEEVLCDDMLFATLDPWTRKWALPSGKTVLLSDTVGFIQGLPHELVFAFRATLEESLEADLIIHVVDISSPIWMQQMETVENVLRELGAGERPMVIAFNKADRVSDGNRQATAKIHDNSVDISALHGYGIQELAALVEQKLMAGTEVVSWEIPYSMWDLLSEIRQTGTIIEEAHDDKGARIVCRLSPADVARFSKKLLG